MKIAHPQELQPFMVPYYVLTVRPVRPCQEGFVEGPKYALHELSDATLDILCRKFREDVFAKAIEGRKPSPSGDSSRD